MIERLFKVHAHGSTVRIEVLGGITTFATMAYIIVVNPAILSFAGIPVGPSTVATILVAIFGSLLMGLIANRPFAVAPYMGENAFIAFGLAAMGIGWQQRLGTVFVAGVLFLLLTAVNLRTWLANGISRSLKLSLAAGIGLFLALIGLYESGIVTSAAAGMKPEALTLVESGVLRAPDVPLKIGSFHEPKVMLAVLTFVIIAVLIVRRVKGAILIGMALAAIIGGLAGLAKAPEAVVAMPFTGDYSLEPIAMKMDIVGAMQWTLLPIVFTLVLMSFLDTTGTLYGLGATGGLLDKKGELPDVHKPFYVDALSCIFAGAVGTSTSGAYIESASGMREGAKTGLAAVVVALLFGVSLFFLPVIQPLQGLTFAYGPALVVVGLTMAASLKEMDFGDLTELIPGIATIVMLVFTYNIANGLTAGLILHPILKTLGGKAREVRPAGLILAAMCLVYYVWGLPH